MSTAQPQHRRLSSKRSKPLIAAVVAIIAGSAMVASTFAQPTGRPQRPNGGGGGGGGGGQGQRQNDGGPGRPGQGGPGGGGGPGGRALAETLGLRVRPVPPNDAGEPNAKPTTGLIVQEVNDGSAAATAGLVQGDRIVKMGDQLIINPQQLTTLLALQDAGASVTLDVQRQDAATATVTLKLDEAMIDALRKGAQQGPPRRDGENGGPDGNGGPNGGPDGGQGTPPPPPAN